jgi:phospholipid-binding lipoprotein MlaA
MRPGSSRPALAAIALLLLLATAGCAATPPTAAEADNPYQPNDPLEDFNRKVFDFNLTLDDYVLKPTAEAYRDVLPEPVRDSVRNFFNNLRSPITFFNDVLQGEGRRAIETVNRIWMNTVIGIGGLFDVATYFGIPYHEEDFGQTLAVWGVPDGPYLMLPLLGPSNPRDGAGTVAGFFADPLNIYLGNVDLDYVPYARASGDIVDVRSRNIEILDRLRSTSLDYYAEIRSIYRQRRAADIRNEGTAAPNPVGQ